MADKPAHLSALKAKLRALEKTLDEVKAALAKEASAVEGSLNAGGSSGLVDEMQVAAAKESGSIKRLLVNRQPA